MFLKFPSIGRAATSGYVYDTEAWSSANGDILAQTCLQFDTYGDGFTAHTPNYCLSFAKHLSSLAFGSDEQKEVQRSIYTWPLHEIRKGTRAFAYSVRFVKYGDDVSWNKRKKHYYSS